MMRIPPAAPSAPTRIEGKRVDGPLPAILIPDPTAADTLTEPGTRSGLVLKRKRISPLSACGFVLGFLLGMALVGLVAHYWLGITHFWMW